MLLLKSELLGAIGEGLIVSKIKDRLGLILQEGDFKVPCGRKRKLKKIATHKRKKKLRKNRHKNK
jgi:hypothetical protein